MAVTTTKGPLAETNRVIGRGQTYGTIDDVVLQPVLTDVMRTPRWWWIGFTISLAFLTMYLVSVIKLITTGIGIFGNNIPVAWGMPIVNFVWWIGIGHAGTLISAILFLFRQNWRTSINRFAEAMTVFAVLCAAIFPALHTGRP